MDAFALLKDCRQFPVFRIDFWKSMYTKLIPNRSVITDEESGDDLDGSQTMIVLRKIDAISKRAKAGQKDSGADAESSSSGE
jgi:hypothetical protein